MKVKKIILSVMAVAAAASTAVFAGCNTSKDSSSTSTSSDGKYIVSIEKSYSSGLEDTYTITYSNGETYVFTVTNGQDGDTLSVDDLFAKYQETYPDATYEDFLKAVVATSVDNEFTVSNKALQSSLKVYTEFTESYQYLSGNGWHSQIKTKYETAMYCGSAVIYSINNDYTYIITNYHVLYDSSEALTSTKLSKKITCYLYGSEGEPTATTEEDDHGCTVYDYGDYAISCEYVGGSITADLAVIKAKTEDVYAINDSVKAVTFADDYKVGESAIAIGNSEGEGISVTSGIVSVDNEEISYSIDGTARTYRSMRIDTAIYGGNSGGGLFNSDGELIGITNAGDSTDQNINYAIPVNIVKPVVENIMRSSDGKVRAFDWSFEVEAKNSKYVYDDTKGYGKITESVTVTETTSSSFISTLGIAEGDVVTKLTIGDDVYEVNRYFDLSDYAYLIKSGDKIKLTYTHNGTSVDGEYTVTDSDMVVVS